MSDNELDSLNYNVPTKEDVIRSMVDRLDEIESEYNLVWDRINEDDERGIWGKGLKCEWNWNFQPGKVLLELIRIMWSTIDYNEEKYQRMFDNDNLNFYFDDKDGFTYCQCSTDDINEPDFEYVLENIPRYIKYLKEFKGI